MSVVPRLLGWCYSVLLGHELSGRAPALNTESPEFQFSAIPVKRSQFSRCWGKTLHLNEVEGLHTRPMIRFCIRQLRRWLIFRAVSMACCFIVFSNYDWKQPREPEHARYKYFNYFHIISSKTKVRFFFFKKNIGYKKNNNPH